MWGAIAPTYRHVRPAATPLSLDESATTSFTLSSSAGSAGNGRMRRGRASQLLPYRAARSSRYVWVTERKPEHTGATMRLGGPVETIRQHGLHASTWGDDAGVPAVEVVHPWVLVVHAEGDAKPSPPERTEQVNCKLGGGEEYDVEPAGRQQIAPAPVQRPDAALRESAKAPALEWERSNTVHRDVARKPFGKPRVRRANVVCRLNAEDFDVPARARRVVQHQTEPVGVRPVSRGEAWTDREDSQWGCFHDRPLVGNNPEFSTACAAPDASRGRIRSRHSRQGRSGHPLKCET